MGASQTTRRMRVTAGARVFIAAGLAYAFSTADEAPDDTMNGVVYAQNPEAGTMLDTGDMVELTAYSDYVAPQATGCDELELVGTEAGVAAQLPATTTVYWTKGDSTQEAVAWDGIDPANQEQGGTFRTAPSATRGSPQPSRPTSQRSPRPLSSRSRRSTSRLPPARWKGRPARPWHTSPWSLPRSHRSKIPRPSVRSWAMSPNCPPR